MNYDAFMEPLTWFLTGMEKHSDDFRQDMIGNTGVFYHLSTIPLPTENRGCCGA